MSFVGGLVSGRHLGGFYTLNDWLSAKSGLANCASRVYFAVVNPFWIGFRYCVSYTHFPKVLQSTTYSPRHGLPCCNILSHALSALNRSSDICMMFQRLFSFKEPSVQSLTLLCLSSVASRLACRCKQISNVSIFPNNRQAF